MHVNVHLYDDLDAVATDAGTALDRTGQPRLYDRIAWFRLLVAHLPDLRPVAIRAERDGTKVWLFLTDRGHGRAEALGCWYTLAFAPVRAGDGAQDILLAACAKEARARFHHITLSPLAQGDSDRVRRAFAATGWGTIATRVTTNRRAVVDGDFESWWATRPGRLRNTVRRKAKVTPFRIEIADRFDPGLWAAYEAVYADSWKGAEGAPALLRALVAQEGAAGTLRLGVAWLDDAPVAAQWWLVENRHATIHKLAYVESARPLSPGTVLSAAMFRHVIDRDRPAVIDFGTGDDAYKIDWTDTADPLWRVDLFRLNHPAGLYRYARARAAALVRARKPV